MVDPPKPFRELDWDADRARSFGEGIVDLWAEWLAKLPSLPVERGLRHDEVRAAVTCPVPEDPMADADLLEYLRSVVMEYSMYPGHPGFMAYISGAGTVPGAAADLLAAGVNQNLGGWRLSPAATEIEIHLTRWFAARFGLPRDAGGIITSGGAMANFTGLKAARDRARPGTRGRGLAGDRQLVLYASEEVHYVTDGAADMLGIGWDAVRKIPVDDGLRMRADLLESAIERDVAAGNEPFAVVGTAGTVSTGAIDPLDDLADLCERYGLWFHIDGAYGAPGVLAEDLRPLFAGIERADSIAFDPHKWLYTPHSGGCILARDMQTLSDAFSIHGTYIYQDQERTGRGLDLGNFGPQFSRGFQALKIWVSLLAHGRVAYARRISHDAELARYLGERVEERDDFELMAPVTLSICCFRYVPPADPADPGGSGRPRDSGAPDTEEREAYLDQLNQRIMTEIQMGGRTYCSNAVVKGRFCLRACIVNFRTEAEQLDDLLEVAADIGARLHHEHTT